MTNDGLPSTVFSVVQDECGVEQRMAKPTSLVPPLPSAVFKEETAKDAVARQRSLPRQIRHDLRSHLNQVLGYSDLLRDEAREQKLVSFAHDLDKIYSAGRELLALINEHIDPITLQADNTPETVIPRQQPTIAASTLLETLRRASTGHSEWDRGHLLIVENNPEDSDSLARHLEQQGHVVTVARTGCEALERAASQSYDLLLLDSSLSEGKGLEVLEALKSDANLRHLPVIMISAWDDMGGMVRSIELGAEDYLTRPHNPILLRARIRTCLEKRWLQNSEQRLVMQFFKHCEQLERGSSELS